MMKNLDLRLDQANVYTLPDRVCQALREAILKGKFEPGERIVQEEIANSLGVSRMPVREALRKLEAEGLIQIEPNRGAVVKPLSLEDIEEIYLLRSVLEKMAVEESLKKIQKQDIVEMESLVTIMDQVDEVDYFISTNIEFHRLLMKHCTKKRLLSFINTLWNGFPQQTPHLLENQMKKSNQEHREILEAVKENEVQKAAELVSNHVQRTGDALVRYIKNDLKDKNKEFI
ncbi:GntR family transcriptional regulator [Ammoniphilus sp. 3BR4]